MVLSEWGVWGRYCAHRASAGKGSAKGCSFIFPSRAQSTILISQREGGRHLARKGRPQCRKSLRPRAPTWLLDRPSDPPPLPPSQGWSRWRVEAQTTRPGGGRPRRFPSNTRPAPSRLAWRDGAGKRGGRGTVAMAAGPPRLTPAAPAGARAPGRAWAVGWRPRLARAPAGTKAQARLEPRGTELSPCVAGPQGRLAPLTSPPTGPFKGLETFHLVLWGGVGHSGPGLGWVNCFGLGISSDLFPYL